MKSIKYTRGCKNKANEITKIFIDIGAKNLNGFTYACVFCCFCTCGWLL